MSAVRYHAMPHLRETQRRSFVEVFARRAKKSWARKLDPK